MMKNLYSSDLWKAAGEPFHGLKFDKMQSSRLTTVDVYARGKNLPPNDLGST